MYLQQHWLTQCVQTWEQSYNLSKPSYQADASKHVHIEAFNKICDGKAAVNNMPKIIRRMQYQKEVLVYYIQANNIMYLRDNLFSSWDRWQGTNSNAGTNTHTHMLLTPDVRNRVSQQTSHKWNFTLTQCRNQNNLYAWFVQFRSDFTKPEYLALIGHTREASLSLDQ